MPLPGDPLIEEFSIHYSVQQDFTAEYLKLTSDFHVFAHRPSPPDGKPIGPNGTATDDSQPTAGLP